MEYLRLVREVAERTYSGPHSMRVSFSCWHRPCFEGLYFHEEDFEEHFEVIDNRGRAETGRCARAALCEERLLAQLR